jgi:hypothetical protein
MAKKRSAQTHAKREREFAVRERRDRKRAKKAEAAQQRAAAREPVTPSTSRDDESPARQARVLQATRRAWQNSRSRAWGFDAPPRRSYALLLRRATSSPKVEVRPT